METLENNQAGFASTHWWLMLLGGITLIGMGIWVLASPYQSYLALSMAFAVALLVAGVVDVSFSIINKRAASNWGWSLAGSTIVIILGIFLLIYPLFTVLILPVILGFWIFYRGLMAIGTALDFRSLGFRGWQWLLATGIAIILLAIAVLLDPVFGMVNIIVWTGVAFIVAGVFRTYLAFKLRKFNKYI